MSYCIPHTDETLVVDQEFDELDWRMRDGKQNEVRAAATSIIQLSGVSAKRAAAAHLLLATIELLNYNYEGALDHLHNSEPVPQPLRARARATSAKALSMLGRLEEAGRILAELMAESPDSWSTWEAVGVWQQRRGEEEEAWKAFLRAAQLDPSNSSVVSHLAAAGLRPERSLDLGRVLEAYLAFEPLNLGFRACLVNCYLTMGEVERARDQAQRIVSFAPFSVIPPEVVSTMSELLRQLQPGYRY